MGDFVMRPEDEMTHKPDASVNFNESVYTNGFDTASPVGGWMRLGNRVNEGYAELSVCLYLPDGRIACQFQRPSITSNARFDAGGLSYAVLDPLKKVSMTFDGELLIVTDANALRDPKTLFANGPRVPGHVHWVHEAKSPVHGGEPVNNSVPTMYGRDFSRGHFNQHGRVRGEIRVGERDPSRSTAAAGATIPGDRVTGRRSIGTGCSSPILRTATASCCSRSPTRAACRGASACCWSADNMRKSSIWIWRRSGPSKAIRVASRSACAPPTARPSSPARSSRSHRCATAARRTAKRLKSRIAEGFTRFTWDGRQGYGMTEYIERIENGKLAGYPL